MMSGATDASQIFAYIRYHGPCALTDVCFALAMDWRQVRDHVHLHRRTLYDSRMNLLNGERTWYVLA